MNVAKALESGVKLAGRRGSGQDLRPVSRGVQGRDHGGPREWLTTDEKAEL